MLKMKVFRSFSTKHLTAYLPTTMSSLSEARGRIRCHMSMVNRVLLLLNIEVREDMSAAIITAIIRPLIPTTQLQGKKNVY